MAAPGILKFRKDKADFIISYIEDKTGVSISAQNRIREVVRARQLAMYVMKRKTGLSPAKIGEKCGGKDRTTVLHACKTVENDWKYNKDYRKKYAHILKYFGLNN